MEWFRPRPDCELEARDLDCDLVCGFASDREVDLEFDLEFLLSELERDLPLVVLNSRSVGVGPKARIY